jgi:hypothetical protein
MTDAQQLNGDIPEYIWDRLQKPFCLDGEWRAAYAHGHSVPLNDIQAQHLLARFASGYVAPRVEGEQ